MSTQSSNQSHFITLGAGGVTDKMINTHRDDVLTVRVAKLPAPYTTLFLMNKQNDSLICTLQLQVR